MIAASLVTRISGDIPRRLRPENRDQLLPNRGPSSIERPSAAAFLHFRFMVAPNTMPEIARFAKALAAPAFSLSKYK